VNDCIIPFSAPQEARIKSGGITSLYHDTSNTTLDPPESEERLPSATAFFLAPPTVSGTRQCDYWSLYSPAKGAAQHNGNDRGRTSNVQRRTLK
jgi:hypothetical protein